MSSIFVRHGERVLRLEARGGEPVLDVLRRDMLAVTETGSEIALGVCKWHEKADETAGYMNLMLN